MPLKVLLHLRLRGTYPAGDCYAQVYPRGAPDDNRPALHTTQAYADPEAARAAARDWARRTFTRRAGPETNTP